MRRLRFGRALLLALGLLISPALVQSEAGFWAISATQSNDTTTFTTFQTTVVICSLGADDA